MLVVLRARGVVFEQKSEKPQDVRGEQRAAADDAGVFLPRVLHGAALLTREADRRLPSLPLLPHEQDLLEEGQ